MKSNNEYRENLKKKMNKFVKFVYRVTKNFPKEELYGITSQLRRAALSVILNYIEGFARKRPAVQLNFFEISYGSIKEAEYLLRLSGDEGYLKSENYDYGAVLADEIGAMLWTEASSLERSMKS